MKAVKILGGIVLGLFGLVVLLYLVGLAINWKDQPPSAEALAFQKLLDERPQVADADNAYLYQLGMAAPADQDPQQVGALRFAWLVAYTGQHSERADPLAEPLEFTAGISANLDDMEKSCREDDRKVCAKAFLVVATDWRPNDMESLLLQRYRALLGHLQWREVVPLNVSAPMPSYADGIRGQRVQLLTLVQLARKGDAQAVRDALEADSVFWRAAARNPHSLIGKMIGVAGLRNHYFFSNLILRELPADRMAAAIPPDWRREYSAEERSLRLAMAGELAFIRRLLRDYDLPDPQGELFVEPTMLDSVTHSLARPFLKIQDTTNRMAAGYELLCAQFDRPMREYAQAEQAVKDSATEGGSAFAIYNPAGLQFVQSADIKSYSGYAYRAASPEGMRRAALLTADLRARGVARDQVAAELTRSDLRDPYQETPFEWDAALQAVIFTSPDDHQWRRHEFVY